MPNNKTLFVCQHEEGEIALATKAEIDRWIIEWEKAEESLPFETIAKIPAGRLHMDITVDEIEWYKPEFKDDKKLTDQVILKAVQYLL